MKIRTAIFGTYTIASAVGLAVLMRFVLAEVRPRYVSSLERTMQESVSLVAAALRSRPAEDWPVTLADLAAVQTGMRLHVEDAAGEVIFDSQPEIGRQILADYAAKQYRSAKNEVSFLIDSEPYETDRWLRVQAGVDGAAGLRRVVVLSRPLRTVNAFIWSERKKLAGGALLVATVMLGLGWWLANKLTGSLEGLAAYARAVADGRNARPPPSKAQEIAALGEAFEAMRRALEGKDYVEHYTQNLAHELKAPLSAVRGAAELLQEQSMAPAERTKFLGHLQTESARMQDIIDRMLRLAALEAKPGLDACEAVAVGELVAEAVDTLETDAAGAGVVLEVATGDPTVVAGERFLLLQAIVNLVQNAVEFSPAGAVVRIAWMTDADALVLRVEDEGPGIPEFARERVFDRFFSLPRPGRRTKSTGLGLNFVREIAVRHEGSAGLENREGGGARGWIRLPIAAVGD